MDKLDYVGQTSEFARIFGIEFFHATFRGSQVTQWLLIVIMMTIPAAAVIVRRDSSLKWSVECLVWHSHYVAAAMLCCSICTVCHGCYVSISCRIDDAMRSQANELWPVYHFSHVLLQYMSCVSLVLCCRIQWTTLLVRAYSSCVTAVMWRCSIQHVCHVHNVLCFSIQLVCHSRDVTLQYSARVSRS